MEKQAAAVRSMKRRMAVLKSNGFNINDVAITARSKNSHSPNINLAVQAKIDELANVMKRYGSNIYMVGAISSYIKDGEPNRYSIRTQTAHRGYFKRVENSLKVHGFKVANPACPKMFRLAIGLPRDYKPWLNCQQAFKEASNLVGMDNAISSLQDMNKKHAETCDMILVIMPRKSFASAGVQQELMWATKENKPIFVL